MSDTILEPEVSVLALEAFPVEIVSLDSIHAHPRNYKLHPDYQLDHIAQSIKEHGFYRPIVIAQDGTILAGHGVAAAARKLGLATVPVRRLPLAPDDPRALKVMAGDNEISNLAEVDDRALASILNQIQHEGSGLLGTGFDDKALAALLESLPSEPGPPRPTDVYTKKIEIPTYEPADQPPPLLDLFDREKTKQLEASIQAAPGLSEAEREFLMLAAQRHTVFHYNKIADFYAHASGPVQELMEESALVIIDFERAIELGYVELTKRIAAMVEDEYGDE